MATTMTIAMSQALPLHTSPVTNTRRAEGQPPPSWLRLMPAFPTSHGTTHDYLTMRLTNPSKRRLTQGHHQPHPQDSTTSTTRHPQPQLHCGESRTDLSEPLSRGKAPIPPGHVPRIIALRVNSTRRGRRRDPECESPKADGKMHRWSHGIVGGGDEAGSGGGAWCGWRVMSVVIAPGSHCFGACGLSLAGSCRWIVWYG